MRLRQWVRLGGSDAAARWTDERLTAPVAGAMLRGP